MTCVAGWKEGNKRYFVASVNSKHSQWAEQKDRYQCFLYEDISNNMKMSQGQFSGSCQGEIFSSYVSNILFFISGLWSVLEGSRTFSMQKCRNDIWQAFASQYFNLSVSAGHQCALSASLSQHQRWRSLNNQLSIILDADNTSFSFLKSGTLLEQVACHSHLETDADHVKMIAHVQSGWWVLTD